MHGTTRLVWGAFRAHATHSGSPAAMLLMSADPHYRAPPSLAWSEAHGVDGPRQRPHGAQHAASGWTVGGKVLRGRIHGPSRNGAARWRPWKQTEDEGRHQSESSLEQR
jgi:hypothetical protein